MVSVNRDSGRTVNSRMVSDRVNSNRKKDNNRVSRAADSSPTNDNRTRLNPVNNRAANDLLSDSPDKPKALSLSVDNNRASSPASVNRDKVKADNLSRVSNPDDKQKRNRHRKAVNLSRANRKMVNVVSAVRRDWRTAINPAERDNRKGA